MVVRSLTKTWGLAGLRVGYVLAAPALYALYDGDGRSLLSPWEEAPPLANPAFVRMWGFREEDLTDEPHATQLVDLIRGFFDTTAWPRLKQHMMDRLQASSLADHVTVAGRPGNGVGIDVGQKDGLAGHSLHQLHAHAAEDALRPRHHHHHQQ